MAAKDWSKTKTKHGALIEQLANLHTHTLILGMDAAHMLIEERLEGYAEDLGLTLEELLAECS